MPGLVPAGEGAGLRSTEQQSPSSLVGPSFSPPLTIQTPPCRRQKQIILVQATSFFQAWCLSRGSPPCGQQACQLCIAQRVCLETAREVCVSAGETTVHIQLYQHPHWLFGLQTNGYKDKDTNRHNLYVWFKLLTHIYCFSNCVCVERQPGSICPMDTHPVHWA